MPPPMVAVIDDADFEWIALGRKLRSERPEEFEAFVKILRGKEPTMDEALTVEEEIERLVTGDTD